MNFYSYYRILFVFCKIFFHFEMWAVSPFLNLNFSPFVLVCTCHRNGPECREKKISLTQPAEGTEKNKVSVNSVVSVRDRMHFCELPLSCHEILIKMAERMRKSDHQEGIIRPMRNRSDPAVGPDAVMAIISSDLEYLVDLSRAEKTAHSGQRLFRLYRTGTDAQRRGASLSGPFLGAPVAAMGMEKLIAMGAERIWVLGCCGSLQPDLRIGDLVIPVGALSEEGTSLHYPIGDKAPVTDNGLNDVLEAALARKALKYRKGNLWTTDAPYRETPAKVQAFRDQGILAVEMEMSALMTVGIYRGVAISGLLVVSDELFDFTWRPGFTSELFRKQSRLAAEILLDSVTSFARGPHHEGHEESNGMRNG